MALGNILVKMFGSKYERDIKRYSPMVVHINEIYETLKDLSEEELVRKTDEFRERINAGETIEEIMFEAFAVVKEACRRNLGRKWDVTGFEVEWNMIPFDVQLIGAIALHEGKIAEMATGEGKTLVATMPIYLNALTGKGVHLITVNDYLARRDAEWMGGIYKYLGLTVGCIQSEMMPDERREQYNCDITYGTNSEFGFDYLRDNGIAVHPSQCVQRGHYYAIIDEVDSVLIDEARTPLIISGPAERDTHYYNEFLPLVKRLFKAQYEQVGKMLDEAQRILENEDDKRDYDAGHLLLKAKMALPKNRRFLKMMEEGWVKKLIEDVETNLMRDKKMTELVEDLYFSIDERGNTVELSDKGRKVLSPDDPELFIVPDLTERLSEIAGDETMKPKEKELARQEIAKDFEIKNERLHNIHQLLKSFSLFEKDVDYVIQDGRVVIVDEFTGRLMPSRRYTDGLHQAIEAKEGVAIREETQTIATITLQNYFRLYEKLAGMTGTAVTEAPEFYEIYKMDVVVIPTNEPVRRIDYDDEVYKTKREKYNAIIDEILRQHEMGRPVLVGTISVDVSETLSRMLSRHGIKHSVLNARQHQKEAEIITLAGQPGAVTIATNMAGRGTDIKLGPGVVKCNACTILPEPGQTPDHPDWEKKCKEDLPCGVVIIGTERHEARRIDRQLRGRSGRQGDPGSSRFYLSLEDDLMRLFGSDRIASMMNNLKAGEGEPITHPLITRVIEYAQKKVEELHFSIRKRVLDYDDVMNKQREVIYEMRGEIVRGEDIKERVLTMIEDSLRAVVVENCPPKTYSEDWNWDAINGWIQARFPIDVSLEEVPEKPEELEDLLMSRIEDAYNRREEEIGAENMRAIERVVALTTIDTMWKEHLYEVDYLREGISLRGYGGLDPLVEYKKEAFEMFSDLMERISNDIAGKIFRVQIAYDTTSEMPSRFILTHQPAMTAAELVTGGGQQRSGEQSEMRRVSKPAPKGDDGKKVGRNDPCPCGSGKKYKQCCMPKNQ
jgi:preprotein translocase subunit SecA